jgi:molybdenum cofactor cytidylyltransferase
MLVDQPAVGTELLNAVLLKYRETGAAMVAPRAGGRRANPVLFDRALWPELRQVRGDVGGRALLDRYSDKIAWVDWGDDILAEINTGDDYVVLRERDAGK